MVVNLKKCINVKIFLHQELAKKERNVFCYFCTNPFSFPSSFTSTEIKRKLNLTRPSNV